MQKIQLSMLKVKGKNWFYTLISHTSNLPVASLPPNIPRPNNRPNRVYTWDIDGRVRRPGRGPRISTIEPRKPSPEMIVDAKNVAHRNHRKAVTACASRQRSCRFGASRVIEFLEV